MAQFRFETEVQVKATIEYLIEADSLEEDRKSTRLNSSH